MGKKQKEETPNINATPNRDIIQRLNFLYQASVYLQSLEPSASIPISSNHPSSSGKGKSKEIQITESSKHTREAGGKWKKKHKRKQTTSDIARNYVRCMRIVGQKTTVKIDPALKRSLCSSCNTILIPGSSASVRLKKSSSHGHLVVYTCLHCKSSKGIPAPSSSTLNPALATGTGTGAERLEGSIPTAVLGTPESIGLLIMTPPSQSQVQKAEKKMEKNSPRPHGPHPRQLPLFARPDAGHVVFRGNEVLDQQGLGGLGVCFI